MSDTPLQTIAYIEESGLALKAAQDLASKVAAQESRIAELAPGFVNRFLEAGLITDLEKEAAAESLSTHVGSLHLIGNLLTMLQESQRSKQASTVEGRSVAGRDSGSSRAKRGDATGDLHSGGYVGRRRGAGEVDGATEVLISALGLDGRVGRSRS